jgi:uncharacterized protein YjbI with pentapeptide repeats
LILFGKKDMTTMEDQRRTTEDEQPTSSSKHINAPGGQFGVVGDKAHVEGGIHFTTDLRGQAVAGDQYQAGRDVTINQAPPPSPGPPNTRFWQMAVSAGIMIAILAGLVALISDSLNIFGFLGRPAETESAVLEVRQAQEEALQAYFAEMSDLLITQERGGAQPTALVRESARSRTAAILLRLDGPYKREVLEFLYHAGLITGEGLVDLRGANLAQAQLADLDLRAVKLKGANLAGASLHRANLTDADLSEADLFQADLTLADLTNTNLSQAYLAEAKLVRVNLAAATLADNDLTHATLRFSSLVGLEGLGLDLSGADLSYASLQGANLENAIIFEDLILQKARYNSETIWPAKLDPSTAGAILAEE